MITASTATLSPWLDADLLDGAVALGAQDVLHLHRLDDGQRLAGLDLLPFGDGERNDEAGHRAAHGFSLPESFFAGISRA
jgi:hypothetical protein